MEDNNATNGCVDSKSCVNLAKSPVPKGKPKAGKLKYALNSKLLKWNKFSFRDNVLLVAAMLVLYVGLLEESAIYIFVFGYLIIHTEISKSSRLLLDFTFSLMGIGWLLSAGLILMCLIELLSVGTIMVEVYLLLLVHFGGVPCIGLLLCKIAERRFGLPY
ncbi:MAG: hypothetical protein ACI33P_08090 [Lysinibacillus sp.]